MSEKVVAIASVLKPVDDTRMFEKLGLSIRESKQYPVNIIGFESKNPPVVEGIGFHGIYSGSRLALTRLLVPWRLLFKLIKIKPQLLIVCTPELLTASIVYKLIWGTELWYDVQENYQKNVQYQSVYHWLIKPLLRSAVWLIETGSQPFIDHYLLAERGYLKELSFINGQATILENKFKSLGITTRHAGHKLPLKLIFSGTCSRPNGIVEAVLLLQRLYGNHHQVQLDIIGQFPDSSLHQQILEMARDYPISVIGDGSLISHTSIMELAAKADFGLVAHRPDPSTDNCIPTKIYEYLGLRLPMILQRQPLWETVVKPYQAALLIDFQYADPDVVWEQMQNTKFYTSLPGPEITWEKEWEKLLKKL